MQLQCSLPSSLEQWIFERAPLNKLRRGSSHAENANKIVRKVARHSTAKNVEISPKTGTNFNIQITVTCFKDAAVMQLAKQVRAVNFWESTTKYTPVRLIACGSCKKIRKARWNQPQISPNMCTKFNRQIRVTRFKDAATMQLAKQVRAVNFWESITQYTPERLITCGSCKKKS